MLLYVSWIDFIAPHCIVKSLNSRNSKDRVLYMFGRDDRRRVDRGSMQMVLMPYDLFSKKKEKTTIRIRMPAFMSIQIQLDQMAAHSFRADPSPSRPIWLFLLVLFHVVPAFAGHWLLIFSPFRRPRPAFTPSSHADPISLRSQATARFHVGHSTL